MEQPQRFLPKTIPECPFQPMRLSYLERGAEFFMGLAYNSALKAWRSGEVPVGAVVEFGGEIVAQAHNMVETTGDPTAHAEILAITQASSKLGGWRLSGANIYVTKEPCPMCSGACIMARLDSVTYAISDPKMGFLGGAIAAHEVKGLNHRLKVEHGVLADECAELLRVFFASKR